MSTLVITLIATGIAVTLFSIFVKYLRYRSNLERSFNMVFLEIKVPRKESKEDREVESEQYSNQKDFKEITGGIMTQFFESLHGIYIKEWYNLFTAQDFMSFEYAVLDAQVHFFVVCPRKLQSLIEKQLTAFYPDAYVEQAEDYNIFRPNSQVVSAYIVTKKKFWYPIKTYSHMNADPLNGIINSLSKITKDEGAAIQIMIRPKKDGWQKKGRKEANKIFQNKTHLGFAWYNPISWFSSMFEVLFRGEEALKPNQEATERTTPLTDEEVKSMEEKNSRAGFHAIIRLVACANTKREAMTNLIAMRSSFSQYSSSNGNALEYTHWHGNKRLVTNFIFRNFWRGFNQWVTFHRMLFSAEELASIFHVPNIRFNKYPSIAWQNFKISPPPANIPTSGLLLGHNVYRGEKKEIRLKTEDRFRHFYVIGQTGTGKSSILQVMIRQDLKNGNGLCVIDPHGSLIEDILPFIPRERADDVIYFDPADMERPLGMNLLEGETWEEKELVALDAMNIMIKLFDEE
ncbi:DUF87 domain-containing protein, partial [Candidatus Peregrinibacteria bacterium]|nr:DUF87 domain-containing protein [Candidatus Peregrinibacteria bacterium]